jgi:NAD(P)-dependent dehydrogenase (short-subunit alcohol dehydrogenase family)
VFEGKAVAITGATSELGAAVALAFAERGAAVALAARRAERLDALAREVEDEGGRALALPTDVADERQARAFVEHAYEHLGRLDVLVNAVAEQTAARGALEDVDERDCQRVLDTTLGAAIRLARAALPAASLLVLDEHDAVHLVGLRDGPFQLRPRDTLREWPDGEVRVRIRPGRDGLFRAVEIADMIVAAPWQSARQRAALELIAQLTR